VLIIKASNSWHLLKGNENLSPLKSLHMNVYISSIHNFATTWKLPR
jgi:hypothetical protein